MILVFQSFSYFNDIIIYGCEGMIVNKKEISIDDAIRFSNYQDLLFDDILIKKNLEN